MPCVFGSIIIIITIILLHRLHAVHEMQPVVTEVARSIFSMHRSYTSHSSLQPVININSSFCARIYIYDRLQTGINSSFCDGTEWPIMR